MEQSGEEACGRCAAVLWSGDRRCVRCGQPRGQVLAPPPPPPPPTPFAWDDQGAQTTQVLDPVPPAPPVQAVPPAPPVQLAKAVRATPPVPPPPPPPAPVPEAAGPWAGSALLPSPEQQGPLPEPRQHQRRGVLAVAALLLVAVVVASAVLWRSGLLGGSQAGDRSAVAAVSPSSPGASASSRPSASGSSDASATSDPAASAATPSPLATTGVSLVSSSTVARVPSTSSDATDADDNRVNYAWPNMLDGDPETTWRMDGDGAGETITFTLQDPATISRLGLVNGYAKTDAKTGEDRYAQGRRITAVTWTVGKQSFRQRLDDSDEAMQSLAVGPVKGQQIALRIDAVTAPGDPNFDKTAISEVQILG